jgi:hypothetical protein
VDFRRAYIQNLEDRAIFIGNPGKSWANPLADQTSGSVYGSALKSMTQRLCSAGGLVGLSTSWLPLGAAVLPHSGDRVSGASLCDALDPAFPASREE